MTIINSIFQIGLTLFMALTALQLIRKDDWWIRMSDFPHIQLTVLTLIFFLGTVFTCKYIQWHEWFLVGFGAITLIYQVVIIYPYTTLSSKQAKDWSESKNGQSLAIMESNVYQYNEDYHLLVEQVEKYDPDLLITLETDKKWEDGLSSLEEKYPNTIKLPLDNTYGVLFYSKLEIVEHSIEYLIDDEIPSIHAIIKLRNGELVKLYIVHPEPPSPTENYRSTERDAELIVIGKMAVDSPYPVIVAGDLNDVAWSHTTRLFQRLSNLLDPRIGRGFFNTFHAKYRLMRWPLDHVFHSDDFLVKNIERVPNIGSDHFPMYIELSLESKKAQRKNGSTEEFSTEDKEEAKKKLEKVKE